MAALGEEWNGVYPQQATEEFAAYGQGDYQMPEEEDGAAEALSALVQAMGRQVTPGMAAGLGEALFAEAIRLLTAVLGFACEGNCPPLLRGRAVIRGVQTPVWRGLVPHVLLGKWFDLPALLAVFWSGALRAAVEGAQQGARLEFLCALSRAASLEQLGQTRGAGIQGTAAGGRGLLRSDWRKVFDTFPDLYKVRTLCAHIRSRCWDDARDRSRSRSRSRERKKKEKQAPPSDTVRFFVKGFGPAEENQLERHFARFGTLLEINILRDKRTKRTRGMAFVTLQPEGCWKGKRNTKQMLKEWVLESFHDIRGTRLEVTEADSKPAQDDEKTREERVEERRRQRLEREMRSIVPRDVTATERLLLSPWAKRWRQEIWQTLPKDAQGPAPWTDPRVRVLGTALWHEAVEYVERTGGKDVQEALAFFRAEDGGGGPEVGQDPWAFMPVAELLLVVGEGLVGMTAEGLFAAQVPKDPVTPASGNDLASMDAPSFAPAPVNLTGLGGPNAAAGGQFFDPNRVVHRGGSDNEKIFVGGLTQGTTLDMLTGYFSTYGPIVDAVVMVDKVTGKPRGFGFVVFDSVAVVDAVIRDHGRHRIDGKWVDVKRATPQALLQQGITVASSPVTVPPPASGAMQAAAPAHGATGLPAAAPASASAGPMVVPPRQEPPPEATAAAAAAAAAPAAAPRFFVEAQPAAPQPMFGAVAPPPSQEPAPAPARSFSEVAPPAGHYNPLADM